MMMESNGHVPQLLMLTLVVCLAADDVIARPHGQSVSTGD